MFKTLLLTMILAACGTDATDSTTGASNGTTTCPSSGAACSVDTDCPANEECEDGACKAHGGDDCTEDNGVDDDPQGNECTLDADCGAGLECEDGFCKPHGG